MSDELLDRINKIIGIYDSPKNNPENPANPV
jgi:hypothetical protein